MRWRALLLVGALVVAAIAAAAQSSPGVYALTPPRPTVAGEAIWLKLTVGPLPRGTVLRVSTEDGRPVGTIAPFGAAASQSVQDHLLALPTTASAGAAVRLRIELQDPNGTSRAPAPGEVRGVTLVYVPVTNR